MRRAIAATGSPRVALESPGDLEPTLSEDLPLVDAWTGHDQLDRAAVLRRPADVIEALLETGQLGVSSHPSILQALTRGYSATIGFKLSTRQR